MKIHSRHLHAPLRGRFGPNSVNVARYASLIGTKSPTKWDAQLTESNFQTHPVSKEVYVRLEELWKKYSPYNQFNLSVLPEEIKSQGVRLTYEPHSVIISRGEFPKYIYFIESGTALGTRDYKDGNNYYYFRITSKTGSVGLLEVLAHEPQTIATVVASTRVTVLRISSAVIYEYLMTHLDMLYNCTYIVAHDLYQRSGNDGILYYQRGIDRVRFYLVQYYMLHASKGQKILVEPDYQTIASNIGVSVRTVVRSIQKLKELGEITSVRKKIYISEKQQLIMLEEIEQLVQR